MAFDGLHIIWTTHNSFQPHDTRGSWLDLHDLYSQLTQNGHYYELSSPLHESDPKAAPSNSILLTANEQGTVESYLSKLMSPNGDRIVGGLQLVCCAITSTVVHLLFVPAFASQGQIIGRLKSKTASRVLWSPERKGQKHIWSSGYWFANLNGAEAITKVEQFINAQRGK